MNSLISRPRRYWRWPPGVALLASLLVAAWIAGCGSVSSKQQDAGAGGSGIGGAAGAPGDGGLGGAPGDGAAGAPGDAASGGRDGAAGAPGDAGGDRIVIPPDGGGAGAKWDLDNWDIAQWS